MSNMRKRGDRPIRQWACVALLLVAAAPTGPARAEPFDWRATNHQSVALIRAGRFDEAETLINGALSACPAAANPVEAGLCAAIFQENLASVYEHRGDLPSAEHAFQACVLARETVLPPNHRLIGDCLIELASFYSRTQRLADQVAILLRAETIIRAAGPARITDLTGVLNLRATALLALGRHADAVPPAREAQSLAQSTLGWANPGTSIVTANLSIALINAGDFGAAYALDLDALSRPEAAGFPPATRARLAGALAEASRTAAETAAARPVVEAALKEYGGAPNPDPDAQVMLLYGASRLFYVAGDFAQAAKAAAGAHTVAQARYGAASFAAVKSLWSQAQAEADDGDSDEALTHLRAALASSRDGNLLATEVGITLDLAALLRRTGRPDDANAALAHTLGMPALAASPGRAPELVRLGNAFIEGGDSAHATAACTGAREAASDDATRKAAARCLGDADGLLGGQGGTPVHAAAAAATGALQVTDP